MIFERQLNIKITDFCNAACSFCGYNRNEIKQRIASGYKPFVLDISAFKEKFKALKLKGINKLHLTGGEPFMHPNIIEFIQLAKEWNFKVQTGTNGSLLDEKTVKFLSEIKIDYFWLSLDTFPLDRHLKHRGIVRLKEKFIQGIKLLHEYKINFFGQTVISHELPKKNGTPDIEGHIDYYKNEFGITRFIFSYPMHRSVDDLENVHLATSGSDNVLFSKNELQQVYREIIALKFRRKDVQIINPFISLLQRQNELNGAHNQFGCYAGRDIFFLGNDQATLRPCYFYADDIIDTIEEKPLKINSSYESCTACQDECFRDPSAIYHLKHRPFHLLKSIISDKKLSYYIIHDIRNVLKYGMYKRPPKNIIRHSG